MIDVVSGVHESVELVVVRRSARTTEERDVNEFLRLEVSRGVYLVAHHPYHYMTPSLFYALVTMLRRAQPPRTRPTPAGAVEV